MSYAHTVTVDLPFDDAVQTTRDALAAQGFGVIADIDLHTAFTGKLGPDAAAELGDYRILGACNPHLAQKALRDEPDLGLLLPCNVVIRRAPQAPTTTIQAIDPQVMSRLSDSPAVAEVAADAEIRLRAALDAITNAN
ncbi:MAG: DUF302 domain-containing protein [Pseudonocardiaceae bacterium]